MSDPGRGRSLQSPGESKTMAMSSSNLLSKNHLFWACNLASSLGQPMGEREKPKNVKRLLMTSGFIFSSKSPCLSIMQLCLFKWGMA